MQVSELGSSHLNVRGTVSELGSPSPKCPNQAFGARFIAPKYPRHGFGARFVAPKCPRQAFGARFVAPKCSRNGFGARFAVTYSWVYIFWGDQIVTYGIDPRCYMKICNFVSTILDVRACSQVKKFSNAGLYFMIVHKTQI